MQYAIKIILSGIIIASVSELGKRFSWFAAIIASLPLISILSLTWVYIETKDVQKVIDLSNGIFWAVLPSLLFFVTLPMLLKADIRFPFAMLGSMVVMVIGYVIYGFLVTSLFGVKV